LFMKNQMMKTERSSVWVGKMKKLNKNMHVLQ